MATIGLGGVISMTWPYLSWSRRPRGLWTALTEEIKGRETADSRLPGDSLVLSLSKPDGWRRGLLIATGPGCSAWYWRPVLGDYPRGTPPGFGGLSSTDSKNPLALTSEKSCVREWGWDRGRLLQFSLLRHPVSGKEDKTSSWNRLKAWSWPTAVWSEFSSCRTVWYWEFHGSRNVTNRTMFSLCLRLVGVPGCLDQTS